MIQILEVSFVAEFSIVTQFHQSPVRIERNLHVSRVRVKDEREFQAYLIGLSI